LMRCRALHRSQRGHCRLATGIVVVEGRRLNVPIIHVFCTICHKHSQRHPMPVSEAFLAFLEDSRQTLRWRLFCRIHRLDCNDYVTWSVGSGRQRPPEMIGTTVVIADASSSAPPVMKPCMQRRCGPHGARWNFGSLGCLCAFSHFKEGTCLLHGDRIGRRDDLQKGLEGGWIYIFMFAYSSSET
jgi:hypothetical protein